MLECFLYRFRRMCILSGCDYLPSLPGIGIAKAFKFFSRSTKRDINTVFGFVFYFL